MSNQSSIKIIFPVFLLWLFGVSAKAQQFYLIKGAVSTAESADLQAVTLKLMLPDSTLVKAEIPDASGNFLFERILSGNYLFEAEAPGYSSYHQNLVVSADQDLGPIALQPVENRLQEVVVTKAKPFITHEFDKTVLNVASSISATGSTALEVLEKAPGITIDQNDNISMRGRQGVMVMIDGKRVPMSGVELVTLLRGTSANSIEKIDLITNPSAKYDAQGQAGIIDIRLKKDNRTGTNGSVTGSAGLGIRTKGAGGLSLNNRTKKFNFFGSYNFTYREELNDLHIYRRFYDGETFTGAYDQSNLFNTDIKSHNFRVGADYYLSDKTIIGVITNGVSNGITTTTDNASMVFNDADVFSSSFFTSALTNANRNNRAVNLNLKHTFKKSDELSVDVDYARYANSDLQNYTTRFTDTSGQPTQDDYVLYGDLDGMLDIKSVKADYSKPVGDKGKLEGGFKSSWVKADNDIQYFDRSNGGNVPDPTKSNHFVYRENINAAYVNANRTFGKFDLQLGLRVENTNASGEQLTDDVDFDQHYTQLFPSFYTGYRASEKHELGLSLSRRINRPTYNQLNPFRVFLDPSTYSAGNPYLQPELTNSLEFTHTYNQKIISKLSYSHTSDGIVTILAPVEGNENVIIQTDSNLAKVDYFIADVTFPVKVGRWLQSTNNVVAYYAFFSGNIANTDLHNGAPSFSANSTNRISLKNDYSAEVTANYQSRVRDGFLIVKGQAFLNIAFQKLFWQKKASLKLNFADVFYSRNTEATTELTGYKEAFHQRRDTRVATLSFSYRFGKNQLAPARRRQSGAEEEQRRAG